MAPQRLAKRTSKKTDVPFSHYKVRPGNDEINSNQLRFIEEYLVDMKPAQALIRAGFSAKSADSQASQLLSKPKIAEEIAKRIDARAKKFELKSEHVIDELVKLGFSNIMNYIKIDKGVPYFDLSNTTIEQMAAVSELVVDEYTEGKGDDARNVKRTKFKLAGKVAPLELLGKHLGMFKNALELTGPGGGPLQVQTVSRVMKTVDGEAKDITPRRRRIAEEGD